MEQGLNLLLQFTAFNMEPHSYCGFDHLTITDGDGRILMERSCGSSDDGTVAIGGHGGQQSLGSSLPANIRSLSNSANLMFKTDFTGTMSGWSVSWSAVTLGECQTLRLGNLSVSLISESYMCSKKIYKVPNMSPTLSVCWLVGLSACP